MRPVIAIPKPGPGLLRRYMAYQFQTTLTAAGAKVRWIDAAQAHTADRYDGLLIPGGDDVDPALYGQKKSEKCGKQNPLRDTVDPVVLKTFLPTGKPILGVCRGMQMLNVYLGGTLHQDIRDLQKQCHQQFSDRRKCVHDVTVAEDSLLRQIVGVERLAVNTVHHQAADALGRGLRVTAESSDGIVEAVELEGHPFCLGVQWHPEFLFRSCPEHRRILAAFVDACRKAAEQ